MQAPVSSGSKKFESAFPDFLRVISPLDCSVIEEFFRCVFRLFFPSKHLSLPSPDYSTSEAPAPAGRQQAAGGSRGSGGAAGGAGSRGGAAPGGGRFGEAVPRRVGPVCKRVRLSGGHRGDPAAHGAGLTRVFWQVPVKIGAGLQPALRLPAGVHAGLLTPRAAPQETDELSLLRCSTTVMYIYVSNENPQNPSTPPTARLPNRPQALPPTPRTLWFFTAVRE